MALSLSPDCSATLIFNKRDEDINQVLLAALTKTLNVLYGVSKHASHPSLSEREGQKEASTEAKKKTLIIFIIISHLLFLKQCTMSP